MPAWSSIALSKHMVTSSPLSCAFSNELPQVYLYLTEKCVFDRGNRRIANKRGAICCLLCCGKQLDQKCNDLSGERACPTGVDAVRLLRA